MAKLPKTRISDESELVKRIDRLLSLKARRLAQAAEMDAQAKAWLDKYCCNRRGDDPQLASGMALDAKSLMRKARRLRASASTDERFRYYKAKLAQLRTGILPGVIEDGSVRV